MEIFAYIIRCAFMFLVTWACVRLLGKKSIANMTSYDFASIMLITTVAAEPLVFKTSSKATVGIAALTVLSVALGLLSLKKFFYNVDSSPTVLISNGKIIKNALKRAQTNVPLMMSELRLQGYANLADVAYAVLEPNGKISVIPSNQSRPVQPSDMGLTTAPMRISFPVIIDGQLKEENLKFLQKDMNWLMDQLKICGAKDIKDVLFAQIDTKGNIYVDIMQKQLELPELF